MLGVASGLWTVPIELEDYRVLHDTPIPLMLDESGEWFRSFEVSDVPTLLVADGSGRLVRRIDGFNADWPIELGLQQRDRKRHRRVHGGGSCELESAARTFHAEPRAPRDLCCWI